MKPEDLVIEVVEDDLVIAPRSYADGRLPVLIEVTPLPQPKWGTKEFSDTYEIYRGVDVRAVLDEACPPKNIQVSAGISKILFEVFDEEED